MGSLYCPCGYAHRLLGINPLGEQFHVLNSDDYEEIDIIGRKMLRDVPHGRLYFCPKCERILLELPNQPNNIRTYKPVKYHRTLLCWLSDVWERLFWRWM